jgi:ABC-type oligopeptide transport system substrate-binding subunit
MEKKTFNQSMNQHTHNFHFVPYKVDYLDPSNFMDLFMTGGRHNWSNDDYDKLVAAADASSDEAWRMQTYNKAEKLLLEESPAVFVFQVLVSAVWKPFLAGEGLEPSTRGYTGWDGIWELFVKTHMYIEEH